MAARYPKRHGTPMRTSFAQIRLLLLALVLALASTGCASVPPPTNELAAAQQAVMRADGADADQYAAAEIGAAESGNALYAIEVNPRGEGDLAIVRARFKTPGTTDYHEHEWTVPFQAPAPAMEQASSSLRLAASAGAFSEWLAQSPFAAEVTTDRLLGLMSGLPAIYGADPRPAKLEGMIRQAKSISGR